MYFSNTTFDDFNAVRHVNVFITRFLEGGELRLDERQRR